MIHTILNGILCGHVFPMQTEKQMLLSSYHFGCEPRVLFIETIEQKSTK